jgi:hypothetical protein
MKNLIRNTSAVFTGLAVISTGFSLMAFAANATLGTLANFSGNQRAVYDSQVNGENINSELAQSFAGVIVCGTVLMISASKKPLF